MDSLSNMKPLHNAVVEIRTRPAVLTMNLFYRSIFSFVGVFTLCVSANNALNPLAAQTLAELYFPYAVGDSVVMRSGFGAQTSFSFTGSYERDSKTYLIAQGIPGGRSTDTLRVDTSSVYRLEKGNEVRLFDFGLSDSAVYHVLDPGYAATPFDVRVRTGLEVLTPVRTFSDGIQLSFDHPNIVDEEYGFIFAPSFGIVSFGTAWINGDLFWLSLGGVIITDVESGRDRSSTISVYPNPAVDFVAIDASRSFVGEVSATVFDLLGREVVRTRIGRAGRLTIDINALTSGHYLLKVNGDGVSVTQVLTVAR